MYRIKQRLSSWAFCSLFSFTCFLLLVRLNLLSDLGGQKNVIESDWAWALCHRGSTVFSCFITWCFWSPESPSPSAMMSVVFFEISNLISGQWFIFCYWCCQNTNGRGAGPEIHPHSREGEGCLPGSSDPDIHRWAWWLVHHHFYQHVQVRSHEGFSILCAHLQIKASGAVLWSTVWTVIVNFPHVITYIWFRRGKKRSYEWCKTSACRSLSVLAFLLLWLCSRCTEYIFLTNSGAVRSSPWCCGSLTFQPSLCTPWWNRWGLCEQQQGHKLTSAGHLTLLSVLEISPFLRGPLQISGNYICVIKGTKRECLLKRIRAFYSR